MVRAVEREVRPLGGRGSAVTRCNSHNADIGANPPPTAADDPVRAQRARWQALASTGQRIGYVLIGIAVGAFVFGLVVDFTDTTTWIVGISLALATLTLAPAMVVGYAVKAAEREDRAQGR